MKYAVPLELSVPDGWTCDDVLAFVEDAINNERKRRRFDDPGCAVYSNVGCPGGCCVTVVPV